MPLIGNNTGEVRPFTAIQLVEEACSRATSIGANV
jgi:hypothetical protein